MENYELEKQIKDIVEKEERAALNYLRDIEIARIKVNTDSIPALLRILEKIKPIYPDVVDWTYMPMEGYEGLQESYLIGLRPITQEEIIEEENRQIESEKKMLRALKQKYPNE